jgi:hypothetical protein
VDFLGPRRNQLMIEAAHRDTLWNIARDTRWRSVKRSDLGPFFNFAVVLYGRERWRGVA